jgi:hypothetical protein
MLNQTDAVGAREHTTSLKRFSFNFVSVREHFFLPTFCQNIVDTNNHQTPFQPNTPAECELDTDTKTQSATLKQSGAEQASAGVVLSEQKVTNPFCSNVEQCLGEMEREDRMRCFDSFFASDDNFSTLEQAKSLQNQRIKSLQKPSCDDESPVCKTTDLRLAPEPQQFPTARSIKIKQRANRSQGGDIV